MFTASPQQPNNVTGTTFSRAPSLLSQKPKSIAIYVFTAGMFLLALMSLGLSFFAFEKRDELQKQGEAKRIELNSISFSQEGATLQDIEDLSGRLRGVISIFTGAPSAGSVFTVFENAAERGVGFSRIEITRVEGSKSYKVALAGKANSFKDLILQRDTLRLAPYSKYVSDVTVMSFSRDLQTGTITFVMNATVSIGRFGVASLLVDLTKPSETLTPVNAGTGTAIKVPSPAVVIEPVVPQVSSSTQQATSSVKGESKPSTP
jgi:hypothetical protein